MKTKLQAGSPPALLREALDGRFRGKGEAAALPLLTDLEKAQLLGVAQGLAMMAEQRQKSA